MPAAKYIKIAVIAILYLLVISGPARADLPQYVTEVDSHVYAYSGTSGYRSMFIVTTEGVIVLEPANTKHSMALLKAIRGVTDQPIRYLLYSHNHWDHSAGGQVFRDEGAVIIAHQKAYAWLKANPRKDIALPDQSWTGSRKDINLGGTTIELHYLGMNHGVGMTVFRLPKEKIVFIADLVTPNRVLFTIVPDFNVKQWERSLSEIEAMDFDQAIFTHSDKIIGSKADVTANRQFIVDLRMAIYAEFKKGTNPMQVPNKVKLPKYKDWAMYDEWLPLNAWKLLLDDHMGPFPWQPDSAAM